MKKALSHKKDDMRAEYDFSSATRNPYAKRFALGANIVMIKPELFAAFPSEEAVNEALESLVRSEKKSRRGFAGKDLSQVPRTA